MTPYEAEYAKLINAVMVHGEHRETRNQSTKSVFAPQIMIDCSNHFPILQGRKMFYNGVFGELAAFVRGPKHIDDFRVWGCNYWDKWADKNGTINVDYGNAWFAGDQVQYVKWCLKHNRNDRRMIINSWRPERLKDLSLPCCHYSYQFYVRRENGVPRLDMLWIQRSTDLMIGLPSDVLLGWAMIQIFAREAEIAPGTLVMSLGDAHIYTPHLEAAAEYLKRLPDLNDTPLPDARYMPRKFGLEHFTPEDVLIDSYEHLGPLENKLELF